MPVPVKCWALDVEASAQRQLDNLATLPFLHHHVAAMPDVHWGMGATVGSVLAMRGAIVPAAVGVDIGCFTGDTEVILADSQPHTLSELAAAGGEVIAYACTPDGKIVAARATALKTRDEAPLLVVELDSGSRIRCTPDQLFMLRDGTYAAADTLREGSSLMPFYSRVDPEGYFRVQQPYSGNWHRAHWIMARSGMLGAVPRFDGQRTVIHHRNFIEADNSPNNLQFMGDGDHSKYHRELVERNTHWQSPEFEAARCRAIAAKAATPEGHAELAARGTANLLRYMTTRNDHFRASVAGNGCRGRSFLVAYNQSERGRCKSREVAARLYCCPECGESIRSPIGLYNHRRYIHGVASNHAVVAVHRLAMREPVYCMRVPGLHNFALASGVFVHNCGMAAVRLSLRAADLPDDLRRVRAQIERDVPVGFEEHAGARLALAPDAAARLQPGHAWLRDAHPRLQQRDADKLWRQVGTLGGGNHFIELCFDEEQRVWVMLHSGSRNIGKVIAEYFISRAKATLAAGGVKLPDADLAWLAEGTPDFDDYVRAVGWAQDYALENRAAMLRLVLGALGRHLPPFTATAEAIHCHHNYVSREHHYGADVLVTRKGAIRAGRGELGIIPGSMGTRSYIVRGKGCAESFESSSHGAGRRMSRGEAKRTLTLADLAAQTQGVECRKDGGVLDEAPAAYKDIDAVMEQQRDLVEVVHTLKQVLCVKG